MMLDTANLKLQEQHIRGYIRELGFDLYGIADPFNPLLQSAPEEHKPQDYLPSVQAVIVVGLEIIDSILQTTPSGMYSKLYDTVNTMLDIGAYKLTKMLETGGFKSMYFTETTHYATLWEQYNAGLKVFVPTFNHMAAAVSAGLGTIGVSGVVLTPQYGPRQRFITVLTEVSLFYDTPMTTEICLGKLEQGTCLECVKSCPIQAISPDKPFNARDCWIHWTSLREKGKACGICIKVCPLGGT